MSSGKIGKHEYLTGKEILLSNQKQIIKQAKLTYSPLEKAFEKQSKTLKPKELETIEDKSDDNEKHLKYKEVFNELSNERIGEIYNISKKVLII